MGALIFPLAMYTAWILGEKASFTILYRLMII